ncbi:hypothetical protein CEXT_319651 [Caerostris extrusa]|uniref:Ribosomal protein S14 n=1 Tax=Caerostris extrusa TaxID=172846 RepID=A0AAV4V9W8_CAEEX|nr:hypothetical protein CEXT_319651 [Caerostris extrusa]
MDCPAGGISWRDVGKKKLRRDYRKHRLILGEQELIVKSVGPPPTFVLINILGSRRISPRNKTTSSLLNSPDVNCGFARITRAGPQREKSFLPGR